MKLCKYCNTYNDNNSLFCEKCGARFSEKKFQFSKLKLTSGLILIIICIIFVTNTFSQYNRYIRQAAGYAKDFEYPAAVSALDHAIQLNNKKTKAYIKKADLYSKLVDDNTVRLIYENLKIGYSNTKSNKIIKAFEKNIKKLESAGQADMALGLKRLAYEATSSKNFKSDYEKINDKIISAYSDILKTNKTKEEFYIVYDIDKNGIPELITGYYGVSGNSICTAYTYSNDSTMNIGDFTAYGYGYSGGIICSYPNANGIFLLNESYNSSERTEWSEVLSLSNSKLISSSYSDKKVVDSAKSLHTPDVSIPDSQPLETFDITDSAGLYSCVKQYKSVYDAYKDILESSYSEKYTLYKINDDTIPELITLTDSGNTANPWKTLICNVYSMSDGKIEILDNFQTCENLYTDQYENLICKNMYGTNVTTDYQYIFIEEGMIKKDTFLTYSSYMENDIKKIVYKYNNNTITQSEYYEKESVLKELTAISEIDDLKQLETIRK